MSKLVIKSGASNIKIFCNQINVCLKKLLEEKKVSPEGSILLKLLQEEISYLREESKVKSEIIRMVSRHLLLFAHK